MMYQAGLVLEGGAMKGVYTAGVLDFFLDAGIDFAKCYGVSAGACCLCSYLSRQKGRQYSVFTDYLEDKNYWGFSSLLRTGDYFNVQMCYHDIPERLNPFDYETFDKNPSKGYAVVTNIETGLAEYLPMKNMHRNIDAVRASTFGELAGALGWQLVCYVFENRRVSYSAAIQCLITVGTVAVLFVIVLLAEKRINRDQKHIHIEKREVILSAVMCICMIAASNLSYVSSSTPFSSRIPSDIYIIRTIVDLAGVSILTAYHIILKESHEKMEMAQMAALNRMQFANYQISRTSVDLINQKYHDLKHQIEFLKREISEEDKLAYLSGMDEK